MPELKDFPSSPREHVSRGIPLLPHPAMSPEGSPHIISLHTAEQIQRQSRAALPALPPTPKAPTAPFGAVSSIFHIKHTPSLEFLSAMSTRLFLFLSYGCVGQGRAATAPEPRVPAQLALLVRVAEPHSGQISRDGSERMEHESRSSRLGSHVQPREGLASTCGKWLPA